MFKRIKLKEFSELNNSQSINIVDIRDPQSFATGHIPKAFLLDNNNVGQYIADADKHIPLIVCCYHGNSSQGAAQYLAEQGFTEVYSLDGGFEMYKIAFPENIEH